MSHSFAYKNQDFDGPFEIFMDNSELEDLTVRKRSPDHLNNVKIGQDQLQLTMKHVLFMGFAAILVKRPKTI